MIYREDTLETVTETIRGVEGRSGKECTCDTSHPTGAIELPCLAHEDHTADRRRAAKILISLSSKNVAIVSLHPRLLDLVRRLLATGLWGFCAEDVIDRLVSRALTVELEMGLVSLEMEPE